MSNRDALGSIRQIPSSMAAFVVESENAELTRHIAAGRAVSE